MKAGDLVRNVDGCEEDYNGLLGMIVEYDYYHGQDGIWVLYFEQPENWKWYVSSDPQIEVVNESR
jgi:hypothetical protein